ncbi:MAG TPA: MFS transporter [Treponemataceae bacterium]|nr:MFS transporter [Treponemataceae bacterium]
MSIVEKPFRGLYVALFGLFVLFGMSMTIIGATLPRILADFGWSYVGAGAVIAAGAIGYFSATFFAGILVEKIGVRATILSGLVLVVAGLMFFAKTSSLPFNLLLNLAIGIGQGFLELTINYATLRMDKSGSGRAMNLMHGAFAIGAVAGPFVIGILLGAALPWALVYRGIAGLFVLLAFVVIFLPFALLKDNASDSKETKKVSLLRHPAYWLGFTCLLLYVGVELGISNWIAEYFVTVFGLAPARGSFMVSLFWGGLLVGRLGVPLIYKGNRSDILLISMTLLMSSTVIALSVVGFLGGGVLLITIASILVALAGLGCSIIYPVVVTFVGAAFPKAQGEAIGFAAMGGGIGAFVFPFIMSNVAGVFGIRTGFATYAFFSVAIVVSCAMLLKVVKAKKAEL